MAGFRLRDAKIPDDHRAFLDFINGSQRFEAAFEPDRRLDATVAEDYLALILVDVAKRPGHIFVPEDETGAAIGWGIVLEEENDIYVLAEQRRTAYISELFVRETWRGKGVGRALIEACEAWAKARAISVMMIGVLPGNTRARTIYESSGYSAYAIRLRKYL